MDKIVRNHSAAEIQRLTVAHYHQGYNAGYHRGRELLQLLIHSSIYGIERNCQAVLYLPTDIIAPDGQHQLYERLLPYLESKVP